MTRPADQPGVWGLATKFFLATYPFAITWAVWVSSELLRAPERYLTKDSFAEKIELIDKRFDSLPPTEWRDRLTKVENKIDKLHTEIVELKILIAGIHSNEN